MRQVARLQARDSGLYAIPISPALDAQLIPEVLTWHLPKEEGYEVLTGPPGDLNWLVQKMKRSSGDDRVAWIFADEATTDTLASRLGDARRTLRRREPGDSSCKALVVFQPESFTAWRQLAKQDKFEQHGIVVMEVRRHTADSLGSWSRVKGVDLPELEAHPSAEKLIRATGGWPMLVDEAVAVLRRKPDLGEAIAACEERLAAEPRALVEASGILADPKARAFFEAATELGDTNLAVSEGAGFLGELAEMDKDDAQSAWDLLRAIAAIEIDAEGFVRPEPVLADCFRRMAKE